MSTETDTRDRVIALERDVRHLSSQVEDAINKLDQMHELMTQTKGAWKVLLGAAGFVGFLSGLAAWLVPPFFQR